MGLHVDGEGGRGQWLCRPPVPAAPFTPCTVAAADAACTRRSEGHMPILCDGRLGVGGWRAPLPCLLLTVVMMVVVQVSDAPHIGTHSGCFHCDEALACAMLKLLPEFEHHGACCSLLHARGSWCLSWVDPVLCFDSALRSHRAVACPRGS